jgi:ribosomal protein S27E
MPTEYLLPWTCGIDEDAIGKGKARRQRKESQLKYSCSSCSANVWGKPGLRLRCDECNAMMVSDDGGAGGEGGDASENGDAGESVGERALQLAA